MVMRTMVGPATGVQALSGLGQFIGQERQQAAMQQQLEDDSAALIQAMQAGDQVTVNQIALRNPELIQRFKAAQPAGQTFEQAKSLPGYSFDPSTGQFTQQVETPEDPTIGLKQQEIDIKKEANRLRALENKERALDRKLARETNDLKRQQLQNQIAQTKAERERRRNDLVIEGENALSDADLGLNVVSELINSPGLEASVGASSILPTLPGSQAANFEAKLEQFQSLQFLNNIQKMKGLGALSEAEGRKVASAAGALNPNMSEKAFRKELDTIQGIMQKARYRLQRKYGLEDSQQEQQPNTIGRFTIEVIE